MSPTQNSSQRANALQKYLLLHQRRERLKDSLHRMRNSLLPITFRRLPSLVPSRGTPLFSLYEKEENCPPQAPPFAWQQVYQDMLQIVEEKEYNLIDLNEQIKWTLTNLLNCEGMQHDKRYKMWVQTRLMDTERELLDSQRQSAERGNADAAGNGFRNLATRLDIQGA